MRTVEQLEAAIRAAAAAYYNGPSPIASDAAFDAMVAELQRRAPGSAALAEVGSPVPGRKVALPHPMMSLDKIRSGAAEWAARRAPPFTVSDKLDGTSAMLVFGPGRRRRLYRRGTGTVGADITHLARHVVPEAALRGAGVADGTAVRGEIVVRKADFAGALRAGFADARSLVNSLVTRKDVSGAGAQEAMRAARFVAYELVHPRAAKPAQLAELAGMGFECVWHVGLHAPDDRALTAAFVARRRDSPYAVDGVVIEAGGVHTPPAGRNPPYAAAFKVALAEQGGEATVLSVEWRASREGRLTPRVGFTPVAAGGVTMRWATGHNARYVRDARIGPGARVLVVRSGDVIPTIAEVLAPARAPALPGPAPPWAWDTAGVHAVLRDAATDAGVRERRLVRFFSAMGVDGLRAGTAARLREAGLDTVATILAASAAELAAAPGVGPVLAAKLHAAIAAAVAAADPVAAMVASGAFGDGLGERRLRALSHALPAILAPGSPGLLKTVLETPGFSAATAAQVVHGAPAFRRWLAQHPQVTLRAAAPAPPAAPPRGTLVFSGFRDAALKAAAEAAGYAVAASVTKASAAVVARDTGSGSAKVSRARELGVPVITEAALRARLPRA